MSAPIPAVVRRLVIDQKVSGVPRCPGRGLVVGIIMVDLECVGQAKERPYKVPSLLATLYQAIGVDPGMKSPNGTGRPIYVLDERQPVTELL